MTPSLSLCIPYLSLAVIKPHDPGWAHRSKGTGVCWGREPGNKSQPEQKLGVHTVNRGQHTEATPRMVASSSQSLPPAAHILSEYASDAPKQHQSLWGSSSDHPAKVSVIERTLALLSTVRTHSISWRLLEQNCYVPGIHKHTLHALSSVFL